MGICPGGSSTVVGGAGEMLRLPSSQGAGAARLIPGPSVLQGGGDVIAGCSSLAIGVYDHKKRSYTPFAIRHS